MEKIKPLVSVIVSTYNSELFFRDKIEDLLCQTIFDKLEIIIVNSGSVQNEKEIIQPYLKKYDNIKYLETEKRETIYTAWNRGIKISTGLFITNSNTDDLLKQNALETLANSLIENPDVALVYANQYFSFVPNAKFNTKDIKKLSNNINFSKLLQMDKALIGSQPMWRASIHFNENLWFDETYEVSGDHDFELQVALNNNILQIKDVLGTFYRSKKTNKSYENMERTAQELRRVRLENVIRYIEKLPEIELLDLIKKIEPYSRIPITLYLFIYHLRIFLFPNRPLYTVEFIYLFTAFGLKKNGNISRAKSIFSKFCRKYNTPRNLDISKSFE